MIHAGPSLFGGGYPLGFRECNNITSQKPRSQACGHRRGIAQRLVASAQVTNPIRTGILGSCEPLRKPSPCWSKRSNYACDTLTVLLHRIYLYHEHPSLKDYALLYEQIRLLPMAGTAPRKTWISGCGIAFTARQ
jgi:hypothetical protein